MAREFEPGQAKQVKYSAINRQEKKAEELPNLKATQGAPTANTVSNNWGTQTSAAQRRAWLLANPDFDEKPATMEEFLGPRYLDIDPTQNKNLPENVGIRAGVKQALIDIFGDTIDPTSISKIKRGMFTGGIGVGKSTLASIALTYMVHWVSCLHDPQQYFGLLPGSRIAFMLMSTRAQHAQEVMFGDIKARVNSCKWFQDNCPHDEKLKKQLRFPKDIWIIPGTSEETSVEGYNVLCGIIDEGDSHKVTPNKDYAYEAWSTIHGRIASRFTDPKTKDHRGLLLAIGQMKKATGFMAKKKEELTKDGKPNQLVVEMAIWDSLGWHRFLKDDGTRDSFWFDIVRKKVASRAQVIGGGSSVIEIPMAYRKDFDNDPVRALKDHAGIPPAVDDPFITMIDRVDDAQDKWQKRFEPLWNYAVNSNPTMPEFHPDFRSTNILKRAVHVDIAYAPGGDALGMAMGHIPELIEIDDELKPVIVIDFLMRIKPSGGDALELSTFRKILYHLRDELKFKIGVVTFDGFQCFTGDTKISLLDGTEITMKELAENYPNGGTHVYSFDNSTGKIVPGTVNKAWKTGTRDIISVTLDNGEVVKCTPDHRWMLRDGTYRQAADLKPGDSLMPLYRRVVHSPYLDGYEQVAQPGPRNTDLWARNSGSRYAPSKWQYTHRMVYGEVNEAEKHDIHHVDHNKLNNSPDNLELLYYKDHLREHRPEWTDDHREAVSKAISKSNAERTGIDARRRRRDVEFQDLIPYAHMTRTEVTKATGWSQDMIYSRIREEGYSGWREFRQDYAPVNHKVVSVSGVIGTEDVYDIEVDDYHNFALSAGVFVHNSQDSIQILRKKHFNVGEMSVDRNKAPYEELREAIYERRIELPKYMTYLNRGDSEKVNISRVELSELQDTGRKIDHPEKGSKDVADAIAGVVFDLMSNISFRRGSSRPEKKSAEERQAEDEQEYSTKVYGARVSADPGDGAPLGALDGLVESGVSARYPSAERDGMGLPPLERDPFGIGSL